MSISNSLMILTGLLKCEFNILSYRIVKSGIVSLRYVKMYNRYWSLHAICFCFVQGNSFFGGNTQGNNNAVLHSQVGNMSLSASPSTISVCFLHASQMVWITWIMLLNI